MPPASVGRPARSRSYGATALKYPSIWLRPSDSSSRSRPLSWSAVNRAGRSMSSQSRMSRRPWASSSLSVSRIVMSMSRAWHAVACGARRFREGILTPSKFYEDDAADDLCPHGYCWPWADHPAAGLERCPKGCETHMTDADEIKTIRHALDQVALALTDHVWSPELREAFDKADRLLTKMENLNRV